MKKYGLITIITFLVFSLTVVFAYAMSEPQEWSKSENRELAQKPLWTDHPADPDGYMQGFEPFLNDQFPLRERILQAYTAFQKKTDRWYVRGVRMMKADAASAGVYYIGDDYLFLPTYRTSDPARQLYAKAIADLCAKTGLPVVDLVLPHKNYALAEGSGGVFTDELDVENLQARIEADTAAGAVAIDLCTMLTDAYGIEERADFYFKSNIHWNPLGAFRVSRLAARALAEEGIIRESSIPRTESFLWKDLSDEHRFPDGLGERLGIEDEIKENIPIYWAEHTDSWRYYTGLDKRPVERGEIVLSGIEDEALDYNKVGTYNLTYIRVDNPDAPEARKVLILKDSYQCTTLDYFSSIFRRVVVLDPRFELPSLSSYVEEEGIDLIFLMYHQDNFLEEFSQYVEASYGD